MTVSKPLSGPRVVALTRGVGRGELCKALITWRGSKVYLVVSTEFYDTVASYAGLTTAPPYSCPRKREDLLADRGWRSPGAWILTVLVWSLTDSSTILNALLHIRGLWSFTVDACVWNVDDPLQTAREKQTAELDTIWKTLPSSSKHPRAPTQNNDYASFWCRSFLSTTWTAPCSV